MFGYQTCIYAYWITVQVDTLSEETVAQKVGVFKAHETTIDFTLQNFEITLAKYKAMIPE